MTTYKATFLEALQYIRDNGPLEEYAHHGICGQLDVLCSEDLDFSRYYESWEHFSGNSVYPVPDPYCGGYPGEIFIYSRAEEMWDKSTSKYAVLRYDLIDHLIKCIEEEKKE